MAKKRSRKRRKQRRQIVREEEPRIPAAKKPPGEDGPPPPLWGSFPLSELVVLVALVMLVAGFFTGPPQGGILLITGLVLGFLAGLELAAREHFAGYRSHSLLLGGAVGMTLVTVLLVALKAPPIVAAAAGVVALGVSAWQFAGAFRRRSGGELFKVR